MDFFERQDRARKKTKVLVLYFGLAVVLTVVAVNLLFLALAYKGGMMAQGQGLDYWFSQPYWAYCTLGTLGVIGAGTGFRLAQLAGGGDKVAFMMGGRRVQPDTSDPAERRYMNVVEEMAIASGVPVPDIFVMDNETGINAFAAGYNPTNAAVSVTRGALETLDRDELQGVIGHEFSHILNGDMRINVRLIGILAGIIIISQIGYVLMRTTMYGNRSRSSGSRKGGNPLPLIGIGLFVIGYIGLFFGRLIKAAISRERENLADSSSVQFTRNPEGIARALVKIKHGVHGSLLHSSHAEDTSHMCFGDTVVYRLSGLFSTHPPLDERIKALSPRVFHDMTMKEKSGRAEELAAAGPGLEAAPAAGAAGFAGGPSPAAGAASPRIKASAEGLADSVGNPSKEHFEYAEALHRSIPENLKDALHTPDGAVAGVYALLLDEEGAGAEYLMKKVDAKVAGFAGTLKDAVDPLGPGARLPVLDLAMPALKSLPPAEVAALMDNALGLVKLDNKVTLFEYALLTVLKSGLTPRKGAAPVRYKSIWGVETEVRVVISAFARVGASDEPQAESAYADTLGLLGLKTTVPPLELGQAIGLLEPSLDKLAQLSHPLKKKVIYACAGCVLHDGEVEVPEGELLRAVSERLDCPMPPLVPTAGAA